jgi:voltage-gated potassium channel Kch
MHVSRSRGRLLCHVLARGLNRAGDSYDVALVKPHRFQRRIILLLHDQQAVVSVGPDPEVSRIIRILDHYVLQDDGFSDPRSWLFVIVDSAWVNQSLGLASGRNRSRNAGARLPTRVSR